MMSLFLSTSTHYPGIRPRNQLVPWNLHASMAGFLAFENGFSLLTPRLGDSVECSTSAH
jgi:hypothetical protein